MANIKNSMESLISVHKNYTESSIDIIAWSQIDANSTHSNESISMPSTEKNFMATDEPTYIDNSMIWTIICDLLGAPCSIVFLYVLYRGIEVLAICKTCNRL